MNIMLTKIIHLIVTRLFSYTQRQKYAPVKPLLALPRPVVLWRAVRARFKAVGVQYSNIALCLGLTACGGAVFTGLDEQQFTPLYQAHLLTSDQHTMQAGMHITQRGGNAVDATIAMILQAQISQAERMTLHQGGLCVGYDGSTATPFALDYSAPQFSQWTGLLALHARFGNIPFPALVLPVLRTQIEQPLSQALITWSQNPQIFSRMAPFADHPLSRHWQQRPAFSTPLGININDDIILALDHASQRNLINNTSPALSSTTTAPIVVGALDRSGLGVMCTSNPITHHSTTLESDNLFGIAPPDATTQDYALPLLTTSYNANNNKLRWVGAFAATTDAAEIIATHRSLISDAEIVLPATQNYMLSYCPVGLPFELALQTVQCASFSADPAALGWWISRQ